MKVLNSVKPTKWSSTILFLTEMFFKYFNTLKWLLFFPVVFESGGELLEIRLLDNHLLEINCSTQNLSTARIQLILVKPDSSK